MVAKSFFTILFLYFYVLHLSADTTAVSADVSSIQLKTFVEQEQVPQNREVVYHVELSWTGPLNRFEISDINEPATTNLSLRSSGSSNKFYQDEEGNPHSVRRITYYFTPVEMGMAYIDGVIIDYRDKQAGQESSLLAQRLGVKIVNPIREGNELLPASTVFLWIVTALFLVIVGFFLFRYMQRRNKDQQEDSEAEKTCEQKYLDLLHETIHSAGDSTADGLNALVRLLNSYLAERSGEEVSGGFDTFQRFAEDVSLAQELVRKINTMYERSERTRFAGESLTQSDFHLFYDSVELLLKQMEERGSELVDTRASE